MKKEEVSLTPQDQQEKAWTQKRIHYHNMQAKGPVVWIEQVQNVLKDKMTEMQLAQIFVPLHLNEVTAVDCLFKNAKLNKIHSMYCDLFEELPYRPDMAFDVAWRSFEVMGKYYCAVVLGDETISDVDMFHRLSKEVILPLMKNDGQIENALNSLIETIPDSTLRFMVVRLYLKRELRIMSQLGPIKKRAEDILGGGLYKDFHDEFFLANGELPMANHINAVKVMRSIIMGEGVEVNGTQYKPLDLESRIELIISCVLYVSRCERYHGDYTSQFKSDKAKLATYHNFYYLLTITDLLFWMVMFKFIEHEGMLPLFELGKLADSSEQRRANLDKMFN